MLVIKIKFKIEIGLAILTIIIFYFYGFWEFPILQDHGIFSLMAQEILRGHLPYTTITAMKGPMVFFLNAFAMYILSFLSNYLAIRVFMLFLSALLVVIFYKNIELIFKDKTMAFIASLILISFTFFAQLALIGSPKVTMVFFWFLTYFFLFRRRFALSGITSSLCFLSYQPGGLIIFAPLIFVLIEKKMKLKKLLSVFLGFSIPILIISTCYFLDGSFSDLLEFSILFGIRVKPDMIFDRSPLIKITNTMGYYCSELLFFFFGFIGLLIFLFSYRKKQYLVFFIPYLLYFLYSFYDYQTGDDFILFLPLVSLFAAITFKKLIELIDMKIWKVIMIFLILAYGFFPIFQPVYPENPLLSEGKELYKMGTDEPKIIPELLKKYGFVESIRMLLFRRMGEQTTLTQQLYIAEIIKNGTSENDKILSLGSPHILFLAERRSLTKYPLLSKGTLPHMLKNVGLENFKEIIERENPKFIIMNYNKVSDELNQTRMDTLQLREYIEKNYERIDIPTEERRLFKRKGIE